MRIKFFVTFTIVFVFAVFVCAPGGAQADENFDILANSSYEVTESGLTRVTQQVRIRNKTEFTYTPTYTITTGINDLKNLKTYNSSGGLPSKLEDTKDGDKSIEVSVPGLTDPQSFFEYNITLAIPSSFHDPSITKPKKNLTGRGPYVFSKTEISNSGILILFGKSQYYRLLLSYHIENNKVVPVKTEIALPPDTSYQDVRIEKMTPVPEDVYQDLDGNWLAVYSLAPRERKTINAEILAHVFATPIFDLAEPKGNLSASKYWEVNDPEIKKIAQELKTPSKIYDFVVGKLSYNYSKVESRNVRLGAKEALKRPDFAVCLEFTDLFIALTRAAGVRARSVEGYAYTQDSKLRPLSLVKDVL